MQMSESCNYTDFYCPEEELCLKKLNTEIEDYSKHTTQTQSIFNNSMHTTSTYLQELHKSDASSKRSRDKIVSLYRKMVEKGENKGVSTSYILEPRQRQPRPLLLTT